MAYVVPSLLVTSRRERLYIQKADYLNRHMGAHHDLITRNPRNVRFSASGPGFITIIRDLAVLAVEQEPPFDRYVSRKSRCFFFTL